MLKIIAFLCLLAVAIVAAKPSSKNAFLNSIRDRPASANGGAILTWYAGNYCSGDRQGFKCDGSCQKVEGYKYHSLDVTGFNPGEAAYLQFFSNKGCGSNGFLGSHKSPKADVCDENLRYTSRYASFYCKII